MVFNSIGLPVEGIGLIIELTVMDMTRTAVNITGDAVCTTIVANMNQALDKEVFRNSGIRRSDNLLHNNKQYRRHPGFPKMPRSEYCCSI